MNPSINPQHPIRFRRTIFEISFQVFSKSIQSTKDSILAFQQKISKAIPTFQPKKSTVAPKKYLKSTLQAVQKERYLNQLMQYIEEEKAYRNPLLTLTDLSKALNISRNHLSQIINEKKQCNFSELINSIRVEEIKKQLQNGENAHYTIIAIAYDAGFNSKSTFYAAFKKYTGMTPSQYRKSRV